MSGVRLTERQTDLLIRVQRASDKGDWYNAKEAGSSLVLALTTHELVESTARWSQYGNWWDLQITTKGRAWLAANKEKQDATM